MPILSALVGKAVEEGIDAVKDKKEREKSADDLKQAEVDISGTLAGGEATTLNFRSAQKGSTLRKGWPFKSVDCYNPTGEDIVISINEVDSLVLPVPDGAQNGDSFDDVGVTSVKIKNKGSNPIDLSDLDLTVSGEPSGVSRGTR
jgi:hypothetical protein